MSAEALFRFTRLRKNVAGRELLSIEELKLEVGHCVLLRGDNGVGKTTLMKILSGLMDAETLSVAHNGVPVAASSQRMQLRSNLDEITMWVLGFGSRAIVRSPAVLRERVARELADALAGY